MHFTIASLPFLVQFFIKTRAGIYEECAKLYKPTNYISHLPSLRLPYFGDIPVPVNSPALIKPSSVVTTKAISVVTKYVYRNPVCVKYIKNKSICQPQNRTKNKGNFDQLVTKEYFVNDGNSVLIAKAGRKVPYEENNENEIEDEINKIR